MLPTKDTRRKALVEALAPLEAMYAEREARRNRCIDKLIASGRFAVVDLDERTVTEFPAADAQLGLVRRVGA